MSSIIFTLNTVLPVFIVIFLGKLLKKINFINDEFINKSSDVVFYVAFPAMIFNELNKANFKDLAGYGDIIFTVVYLTLIFTLSLLTGMIFFKDKKKIGVFAQAVFRGNYGIVSMALLSNMFGEKGLGVAKGAIVFSFATICYNVYSTIGFVLPQHKFSFQSIKKIIFKVFTNPIIISVIITFLLMFIKNFIVPFEYPKFIILTAKSIAGIAFPVALIGIGGSIDLSNIRENKVFIIVTTLLRIVVSPLIFTVIAVYLGFRNESLAALFLLFGVPTAVASFVLARSMEGDSESAANIVAMTTIGSIFTLSVGIFILRYYQLL
ncbi:MAG: AEC family transporter [Spirochaetes bacterium]|nr:AEC family transporter [Spirochaetota bacterium]